MNALKALTGTSIGRKFLVAVTGIILMVYVIGHLAGNLQFFLGENALNTYAELLHANPTMLWSARLALLFAFVIHIVATIKLATENRAARAGGYQYNNTAQASIASRTMALSGLIVLAFVIFHILHYTVRVTHPDYENLVQTVQLPDGSTYERHNVHQMLVIGFSNWLVSGFYILGMFLLFMHLSHGFGSVWQSLGLNNRAYSRLTGRAGLTFAWIIFLGYISIPLSVLFGFIQ